MTPYQFQVWKRKIAKEKRKQDEKHARMMDFIRKRWSDTTSADTFALMDDFGVAGAQKIINQKREQ